MGIKRKIPLILNSSGIFLILTANNGAGYIKLNTVTDTYIEHLHLGLVTITYYGKWKREKQIK
jgi:hypothetical protein